MPPAAVKARAYLANLLFVAGATFGCTRAEPARVDTESKTAKVTPPSKSRASATPAPSAQGSAGHAPNAAASADLDRPLKLPPKLTAGGAKAVRSEHGLVTSVESHATRVGVQILEQGGNAVDAAVAVGYALAVTHPSAGNIGGGGFMLVYKDGKVEAIDFRENAPSTLTQKRFDAMIARGAQEPAAVGVPGSVAGLNLALARHGKLSLARTLAPAIELARKGHRVGQREAKTLAWSWAKLRRDPGVRKVFGSQGRPKAAGSWLKRPKLALALERIAHHGNAGFYSGETAADIVDSVAGLITLDDLKQYRARVSEPLRIHYKGFDLATMPPPSAGGVAVAQTLLLLQALEPKVYPHNSAEAIHWLVESARRAHAERRFAVVDPSRLDPAEFSRRMQRWTHVPANALPINPDHATLSKDVHPLYPAAMRELEHTTHFSVVDAAGNAVACTMTLSAGFGAKIVTRKTGIVLNNSVASFSTAGDNLPAPSKRTTSSMAPTLGFRGGKLVMVLGSPGGDTIPNTVVQVLRNLVDYHMTIDQAVDAPRVHHGFVPDEIRYERTRPLSQSTLAELRKLGHKISRKRLNIGDANNIVLVDGVAYGYADPRQGGLALAAKHPAKSGSPKAGTAKAPSPKAGSPKALQNAKDITP